MKGLGVKGFIRVVYKGFVVHVCFGVSVLLFVGFKGRGLIGFRAIQKDS